MKGPVHEERSSYAEAYGVVSQVELDLNAQWRKEAKGANHP